MARFVVHLGLPMCCTFVLRQCSAKFTALLFTLIALAGAANAQYLLYSYHASDIPGVSVVRTDNDQLVTTIPLGPMPSFGGSGQGQLQPAAAGDARYLYYPQGNMVVVDASRNSVAATFSGPSYGLSNGIRRLVFSPFGDTAYVNDFVDSNNDEDIALFKPNAVAPASGQFQNPINLPTHVNGNPVLTSADGKTLYVPAYCAQQAGGGCFTVYVVDAATLQVRRTISETQQGFTSTTLDSLLLSPDNAKLYAYADDMGSGNTALYVIDVATGNEQHVAPAPLRPEVITPDGKTLYGNDLSPSADIVSFDTTTMQATKITMPVAPYITGFALAPDGSYVLVLGSSSISEVDTKTSTVSSANISTCHGTDLPYQSPLFTPDGKLAYLLCGNGGTSYVARIDTLSKTAHTVTLPNSFGQAISILILGGASLTPAPVNSSVSAGSSATYDVTVQLKPDATSPNVNLSCDPATLPAGASCSFSPATVTPTTAGAHSTLTVTTTAASSSLRDILRKHAVPLYAMWFGAFGVVLVGTGAQRSRRNASLIRWLGLSVLIGLLVVAVACGGGTTTTATNTPTATTGTSSTAGSGSGSGSSSTGTSSGSTGSGSTGAGTSSGTTSGSGSSGSGSSGTGTSGSGTSSGSGSGTTGAGSGGSGTASGSGSGSGTGTSSGSSGSGSGSSGGSGSGSGSGTTTSPTQAGQYVIGIRGTTCANCTGGATYSTTAALTVK